MLIFEYLFANMRKRKIRLENTVFKKRTFNFVLLPKSLGVVFWFLLSFANCTDQKDFCRESVRRKGGSLEGDAESLCLGYVVLENSVRINEERGRPSSIYRFLSDQNLVGCLYKTIEERKCEKKSEYIPHFGY